MVGEMLMVNVGLNDQVYNSHNISFVNQCDFGIAQEFEAITVVLLFLGLGYRQ